MSPPRLLANAAVVGACLLPLAGEAAYDPAAQFSPTQNPSGPWSYGWSVSLGTPFILDTRHVREPSGIDGWLGEVASDAQPGHFPLIGHNGTGKPVLSAGTVYVLPGELWLHPGPAGEYAVLRFTADAPGSFVIRGRFMSGDFYPGVTDAHVLVKGQSVFDGVVESYRAGPSFRSTHHLMAGDVVDFAVGFGNGDFGYDTTLLQATIALIPEPSTAVLWVAGLCSLLTATCRLKQRQQQAAGGIPAKSGT